MPIFISYSHQDQEFVSRLATHLVKHNTHVWVDTWELNVGDSIITKVQEAIQSASALLVVLSEASVQSEWCKKELSAGLMRELEEKRVLVLPLRLDDCEIPLFIKEKLYADFRTNFDDGLTAVVTSISRVTNASQGRIIEPDFHADFALDWGYRGDLFELNFTVVEQAENQPFTVLTQIRITCNEEATARYQQYVALSLGWLGRQMLTEFLGDIIENPDLWVILTDQFAKERKAKVTDKENGVSLEVVALCRRLGEDTGKDIVLNVAERLSNIRSFMRERTRKPDEEEQTGCCN